MDIKKKVLIDSRTDAIFRKFKEGDHRLFLYGIDNFVLGVWNDISTEISISFDDFERTIPCGFKFIGIALIYNDNVYEDFDAVLQSEKEKLIAHAEKCQCIHLVSDELYYFVLKEMLYLDDFDCISFEKSQLEDSEVEVEFCQVFPELSQKYFLFTSKTSITLNQNNSKGIEIKSEDDVIPLKSADFYIFLPDQNMLVDNIANLNSGEANHIIKFISAIERAKAVGNKSSKSNNSMISNPLFFENQVPFQFGIKVKGDLEMKTIESVNCISRDYVLNKADDDLHLDISGMVHKFPNEKGYINLIDVCSRMYTLFCKEIAFFLQAFEQQSVIQERIFINNTIFFPHPSFALFIRKISSEQLPNSTTQPSISLLDAHTIANEEIFNKNLLIRGVNSCIRYPIHGKTSYNPSKLVTVHRLLSKAIPQYSVRACVQGNYEYLHYGHDGINDKGWGCAYRALQTVYSWFLLNTDLGYSNKSSDKDIISSKIPSILDIQTTLVKIGDKEPTFIGSEDWIGAFEVNLVLGELLGIQSQIIYVPSGADLVAEGRKLLYHFQTQGTPIMIGGGVYAYTILGVEYDRVKGDCLFLILDPHYSGEDDMKTILTKGWCEWRTSALFEKGTFYNMCLPLIPN